MARVVVVGGGIAGLASAARLSIKGHEVTVLEQSDRLGGLVRSFERDGFRFDLGPTKLTLPAVYRDLFLKTGASLEDSVDLVEIPDGRRYFWADGSSVLMPSVGGTRAARALEEQFGSRANDDWRALIERAGQMWRIVRPELIERQLNSPTDLAEVTANRQARRTLTPNSSLRKVSKKLIKDKRVRQLVEDYALSMGADPRKAPGTGITAPYIEQTFGTWWITGGIHELVSALESRCLERGVEIRTNTRFTQEQLEAGKVVGLELDDGSTIEADIVVRSDLRTNTPTKSVFTIMVAIQGTTEGLAHENVFLSPHFDAELNQLERGELTTEPTIRICVPRDSTMHPPKHEAWTIQVTAPLQRTANCGVEWPGVDWTTPDLANDYKELIFDQLDARGINVRDRLVWHEIHTPANIEAETGNSGGSAFGIAPKNWQSAYYQPPVTSKSEPQGALRVGDNVQPGAGLDRVGMGAEILAETIGRAKRRNRRSD